MLRRYRRRKVDAREYESKSFPKLFETDRDLADVLFGSITDQVEVFRADLGPFVLGLSRYAEKENDKRD